jgi:hypothetical protein
VSRSLPIEFIAGGFAVFAVFARNYQRPASPFPQKSWSAGGLASKTTASAAAVLLLFLTKVRGGGGAHPHEDEQQKTLNKTRIGMLPIIPHRFDFIKI